MEQAAIIAIAEDSRLTNALAGMFLKDLRRQPISSPFAIRAIYQPRADCTTNQVGF